MGRQWAWAALLCVAGTARADFSYEQTTKMTGGALAGMTKMAGVFHKGAGQPTRLITAVSGNRMYTGDGDQGSIYDLDAGTITMVNQKDRTYSVMTFEQYAEAMRRMQARLKQDAGLTPKVEVKRTGQTRNIQGVKAEEIVMNVVLEGQDGKAGQRGEMNTAMSMWMARDIKGYTEVTQFWQRAAGKMLSSGSNPFQSLAALNPQAAKGLEQAMKELGNMDGMPVLTVVRVGMAGAGEMTAANTPPPSAPAARQAPAPGGNRMSDAMRGSELGGALGGRAGRIAGGLGGALGGFGRRKQQQAETAQQAEVPAAAPAATSSPAEAGALMVMESEMVSYTTQPVEASRLAVPGGFKLVKSELEKMLEK